MKTLESLLSVLSVLITTPVFAGSPSIQFTYVPPVGSSAAVQGLVQNVDRTTYGVALIIDVFGGWWTKPYFATPISGINPDNTFSIPYNTGGQDGCADQFALFVVRLDYAIPLLSGQGSIPPEYYSNSIAQAATNRGAASTFTFAGRLWQKKDTGSCIWDPGQNYFSGDNISVDGNGKLHLAITSANNAWYCAEAILTQSLGYGIYRFYVDTDVSNLPDPIVLGLFTYSNDSDYNHREIDVEFSNGAVVGRPTPWQNVIQPWNTPGNRYQFEAPTNMSRSVLQFLWTPNVVYFDGFTNYSGDVMTYGIQGSPTVSFSEPWPLATQRVSGPTNINIVVTSNGGFPPMQFIRGNLSSLSGSPSPFEWHVFNDGIPKAGNEVAHINLWLYNATAPGTNGQRFEVVISDFQFIPFDQVPKPTFGAPGLGANTLTIPFTYLGN
jgi:hypothetical protein